MRTRIGLCYAVAACAVAALAGRADAGGFELRAFDAKASGMAQAFTAIADNPSAVAYNPAGLSQLDGIQGSIGGTLILKQIHFEALNPNEGEWNVNRDPSFAPNIFAAAQINEFLNFGIGVFAPFGTDVRWDDDWSGRYIAIYTNITAVQVNPSLSFKLPLPEGNFLSIGAGFSIVRSSVRLKQAIDFSSIGAPDAYANLTGDDDNRMNWQWNVGILGKFMDDKIRIGVSYRSVVDNVRINGRAEFYNQPIVNGNAVLPAATDVTTKLVYPDIVQAGIAFSPMEPLTIALQFAWTNWSRYGGNVVLDFQQLNSVSLIPLFWHDTYYYSIGGSYVLIEDLLAVRAGLYYDESPTRKKSVSPSIPDNHRRGFSLGFGLTPSEHFAFDFAYNFVYLNPFTRFNDVGADNVVGGEPRANGSFDTTAHVFTFSVGFKF